MRLRAAASWGGTRRSCAYSLENSREQPLCLAGPNCIRVAGGVSPAAHYHFLAIKSRICARHISALELEPESTAFISDRARTTTLSVLARPLERADTLVTRSTCANGLAVRGAQDSKVEHLGFGL